jgi:hypothetical protein
MQRWFELLRLWGAEPLEIVDTVYPGGVGNSLETREFGLLCGDDQLADFGHEEPRARDNKSRGAFARRHSSAFRLPAG